MARAWEAEFIQLWESGAPQAAISQALGCPVGTVKTRAQRLVAENKIQARPRGGAYPRQQAPAAESSTADMPPSVPTMHPTVQSDLRHPSVHDIHPTVQTELRVLLEEVLGRLATLEAEVQALRAQGDAPRGAWPTLHGAEPADLAPEARKAERWNIYVPRWVRQAIEAEAAAVERPPSWVLQQVVKSWLAAQAP